MKPPNLRLLTPNGRFETNKNICLSISGYHPETWLPSWSIRTARNNFGILNRLRLGHIICHSTQLGELSRMTSKYRLGHNYGPRYRARNGQKP
ncbi:unnamed protein product [Meloidogyne enterolobii]|uniref:Uncharacterized protein n=1 Tax=Meloidogyne enterolobii TaxID=390850 RepID=A0ACB0ZMA4_MELEN